MDKQKKESHAKKSIGVNKLSKKNNATQKKLQETIKNSQHLEEESNNNFTFDFPCINDYCSGKNGIRINAAAWKEKDSYGVFCHHCGNEETLTKEDFKVNSEKFRLEKISYNIKKEKENVQSQKNKSLFVDNYKLIYEEIENDFEDIE